MKNTFTTFAAVAAGISQVAASGFVDANAFTCAQTSTDKCTSDQSSGWKFTDVPTGSLSSWGGFAWSGFSCSSGFNTKRDSLFSRGSSGFSGKCITGTASSDTTNCPSFTCDSSQGIDSVTVKEVEIFVEFDCDLEFHFGMPDGSTCKQRSACSSSGSTITNDQCGGATAVSVVYPSQTTTVPKSTCSFAIPTMSFGCGSSSTVQTSTKKTSAHSSAQTTASTYKVGTTSSHEAQTTSSTYIRTSISVSKGESSSASSSASSSIPASSSTYAVGTTSSTAVESTPSTTAVGTTSSSSAVETTSTYAVGTTSSTAAVETTSSTYAVGSSSSIATVETSSSYAVGTTSSIATVETSSSYAVGTTSAVETTVTSVTSYLTTSTIFTTSVSTITSCASTVTDCPAESTAYTTVTIAIDTTVCPVTETQTYVPSSTGSPAASSSTSTSTGAVETLPCPSVVPSCLNTWLFTLDCTDNTDTGCYCPDQAFVNKVFGCLYAYGESDDIIAEAINYFQGICGDYIPSNPAIATGAETITSVLTATATSVASAVYTTVDVTLTTVVPCTTVSGVTITGSSSTITATTAVTIPQVSIATITAGTSAVGVVPGTYSAVPVSTTFATATGSYATATATATATSTQAVVTAGAARLGSGLGLMGIAMAVMAL
ncbi:hypothetical protein BX600DRAFT_437748 [Xylariales sp. PMI_506]|nr:hypothetical protein BX600DRAFT_437748 [Xylariales sp. PMI_506]